MSELISISEAARILGVSETRVRVYFDTGRLRGEKGPYGRAIERESVEEMKAWREQFNG